MCPLLFFSRCSNIHRLRHEIRSELGAIRQVLRSASAIANWLHVEFIVNCSLAARLTREDDRRKTSYGSADSENALKKRNRNGGEKGVRRRTTQKARTCRGTIEAKNEVLLSNAQKRTQQHSCNTRVREFPLRVYYPYRMFDRLWFREERVQYTHEQLFRLSMFYSQLFTDVWRFLCVSLFIYSTSSSSNRVSMWQSKCKHIYIHTHNLT